MSLTLQGPYPSPPSRVEGPGGLPALGTLSRSKRLSEAGRRADDADVDEVVDVVEVVEGWGGCCANTKPCCAIFPSGGVCLPSVSTKVI